MVFFSYLYQSNSFELFKNIGEKAGITRLHNVTEDRGGEVIYQHRSESIRTNRNAYSKTFSFIHNMLKHGYDSHIIMKITGHNDAKSFKKYVRLTSEDAALLMFGNRIYKK